MAEVFENSFCGAGMLGTFLKIHSMGLRFCRIFLRSAKCAEFRDLIIFELYRTLKKYLSHIYCRRKSHSTSPVQSKRKKSQSCINTIIDMQQFKMF